MDHVYRHWFARTGRIPGPLKDDYAQRFADKQLWVLEVDGEIVGVLVLVEQSDHLLLENVAVRPDAQGRGYGRHLIAFAEQEAMRRGFSALHLCTNVLITENVALYEHLGFSEIGRIRGVGYERICLGKHVMLHAPPSTIDLLDRMVEGFHEILGEHLIGIYLHGSLAFGCFHPETSDIDFLVVVNTPLAEATKRSIAQALIAWTQDAPAKGLEMSIITKASLHPFRYATPYEFHFSNEWLDRYAADTVDLEEAGVDPDLAAHLTVVRERGVCLLGAPIAEIIPTIPREAYLRSIAADATEIADTMTADPIYGVLNLCRVLAFIRDGVITSKAEGGDWGLQHVPAAFTSLVQAAREAYAYGEPLPPTPASHLQAFATYAMGEIALVSEQG